MGINKVSFYDVNYRNNLNPLYKEIRQNIWNEQDIGLTSFFSIPQINKFIDWLDLKPGMLILDACCGNGEIIAHIAQTTGARACGIDINNHSIKLANLLNHKKKFPIDFLEVDLKKRLPFPDQSFDALICIDSIIHFCGEDRLKIFKEWYRILKPGAKLILTDSCIISGVISNDELMQRSIFGGYFFLPPGIQDNLLTNSAFNITTSENITENNARIITYKWWLSREKRKKELELTETKEEIEQIQTFLKACTQLYEANKLEQHAYYAHRKEAA